MTPSITLTPSPTPLGGGFGQIAFASNRSGIPQIYLVNIDGSDMHPITTMQDGACQPSWSPDGARLVFISPCKFATDTYRQASLYLINADGTGLTQLSTAAGGDYDPAWSPNGKQIAFTSLRDGQKEIYILDLGTLKATRLTDVETDIENTQPAWSPYSDQLLYVKKRFGVYQIWVMTENGDGDMQVVRSGPQLWDFSPVWSPDGQYVLFNQRPAEGFAFPWLMQIRYEDRDTQLASRLQLGALPIENVHYSPDGFWLVYEGEDNKSNNDIYFMTATGAMHTRLTTDPGDDFDPVWRPIINP